MSSQPSPVGYGSEEAGLCGTENDLFLLLAQLETASFSRGEEAMIA